MKTGIFVVGALREMELCSKSWAATNPYPEADRNGDLDWHLLTWNWTSDSFHNEPHQRYRADLNVAFEDCAVRFNSFHVFNEDTEYPFYNTPENHIYRAAKGAWFWRKIYKMFVGQYERYVIIRPDLFLWPREGVANPWPTDHETATTAIMNVGRLQDQIFVLNKDGLMVMPHVWHHMEQNPTLHKDPHGYLKDVMGAYHTDDKTLVDNFNFFIARPNSRYLAQYPMTKDIAHQTLRETASWWERITGGEYEGPKKLL